MLQLFGKTKADQIKIFCKGSDALNINFYLDFDMEVAISPKICKLKSITRQ